MICLQVSHLPIITETYEEADIFCAEFALASSGVEDLTKELPLPTSHKRKRKESLKFISTEDYTEDDDEDVRLCKKHQVELEGTLL